jgi:glycosyltransferase involved in cell wall biosynthesis
LKIYFISNYFYPEIGAAPKRITEMAIGLIEAGNNVEVVCPLPNYPQGKIFREYRGRFFHRYNYHQISLRRYWVSPSISKNPLLRVWSMFSFAFNLFFEIPHLRNYKPDCIIIQNSPLFISFIGILVSKIATRSKVVLNISDLWPLSALELGAIKPGLLYNLLQRIERFNYRRSDLLIGQSEEIIEHATSISRKEFFLYRNYSSSDEIRLDYKKRADRFVIVYAGLLGVAQGLFDIVKGINFKSLGTELHIYGDGNEKIKIRDYISENPDNGVVYMGVLSHKEILAIIPNYEAALIPLRTTILGAVPSKIFEMAAMGVPVLFSGGGEGEKIVNSYRLGFTSQPNNLKALTENIKRISVLPSNEYLLLRESCKQASHNYFNFKRQMQLLDSRLSDLIR